MKRTHIVVSSLPRKNDNTNPVYNQLHEGGRRVSLLNSSRISCRTGTLSTDVQHTGTQKALKTRKLNCKCQKEKKE